MASEAASQMIPYNLNLYLLLELLIGTFRHTFPFIAGKVFYYIVL